jgi:putative transposase
MDSQLVMSVLNDALEKYPHPKIFNTDQGTQYISEIHAQRLKKLGITISMDGMSKLIGPLQSSVPFFYY